MSHWEIIYTTDGGKTRHTILIAGPTTSTEALVQALKFIPAECCRGDCDQAAILQIGPVAEPYKMRDVAEASRY